MREIYLYAALSFFLIGCGGGGGSGPIEPIPTYKGYYIDAPVKGLKYTSSPSGRTGFTTDSGEFEFQEGDTISFAIQTQSGSIRVGTYTPATPTENILSVLMLPEGIQVAQVLQSLGTGSDRIDVSNVKLSADRVEAINKFVESGGVVTRPTELTVSADTAINNAVKALSALTSTTKNVNNTFNDVVVFGMSPDRDGGGWVGFEAGFNVLKAEGSYVPAASDATVPYFYKWEGLADGLIRVTWQQKSTDAPQVRTIRTLVQTRDIGVFIDTKPDGKPVFMYRVESSEGRSISPASMSNRTLTVDLPNDGYGAMCSDGKINFVFSADGSSYTKLCNQSAQALRNFVQSGSVTQRVPGVVALRPNNGDRTPANREDEMRIAILSGGTLTSGRLAIDHNLSLFQPDGIYAFKSYRN